MTSDVLTARCDELTALWRRKQAEAQGDVPARTAFTPADLLPYVNELVILGMRPDQTVQFRLVGTAFEDAVGPTAIGGNPYALLDKAEEQLILPLNRRAMTVPCGYSVSRLAAASSTATPVRLISVGLPVRDGDGAVSRLIVLYDGISRLRSLQRAPIPYLLERHQFIDLGYGVPGADTNFNLELTAARL